MKEFVGKVVSNKMQKSVLVAVDRFAEARKYKKMIKRTTKLMAHDESNDCNIGDIVRIHICRPLSKRKSWEVTEVLRREKVYDAAAAAAAAAAQAAARQQQHAAPNLGFAASAVQQQQQGQQQTGDLPGGTTGEA